ncbi:MAG: SDR family oxidoreductase [Paracoccaceae bacterium]
MPQTPDPQAPDPQTPDDRTATRPTPDPRPTAPGQRPGVNRKVAVVCGGTAGVGLATVEALVGRGYAVGVVARDATRLDEVAGRYGEGQIVTAAADVSDAQALRAAIDTIVSALGRPTVWINNAMVTAFSAFSEMPVEEFDRIVDVCLMGQVNGTRIALEVMERGNIVMVGSGLGYRSVPLQSAYCAAKHGIVGFTSSVRSELIADKSPIAIGHVALPALNTPQFDWAKSRLPVKPQPAPPIFQPENAAQAILKAIDTDAREIAVGRSVFQLIIGQTLLPDLLDKIMSKSGIDGQKSDRPETGETEGNLWEPQPREASKRGSFGGKAEDKAVMMDADTLRKIVFFGGAAAIFVLGLLIG